VDVAVSVAVSVRVAVAVLVASAVTVVVAVSVAVSVGAAASSSPQAASAAQIEMMRANRIMRASLTRVVLRGRPQGSPLRSKEHVLPRRHYQPKLVAARGDGAIGEEAREGLAGGAELGRQRDAAIAGVTLV